MNLVKFIVVACTIFAGLLNCALVASAADPVVFPAQQYRAAGEPVTADPDGNYFCEAEEFKVETPGWQAKPWGENYYAATFANTFLSRKAFLGAPETGEQTVATITVDVKDAGKYLVLARYEACYRFETQFTIKIEQGGKVVLNRLYGARDNLKVWAFSSHLQKEVAWPWGAVENVVWEGHDAYADLQPGLAKISLIAGPQPAPQAKRNVDVIMLTRDEAQVKQRIATEAYLPLDGMLTQAGDVWMRAANTGQTKITAGTVGWTEHSSYWIHQRNWKPVSVEVEPGKTSEWVEVGSTMDTLNDGQWAVRTSGPCTLELGLRNADDQIVSLKKLPVNGDIVFAGQADTRYARKLPTQEEGLYDLLAYLKAIPVHGKAPTQTLLYSFSFDTKGMSPKWCAAVDEFKKLYGLSDVDTMTQPGRGYIDLREKSVAQLNEYCAKLTPQEKRSLAVISLGDEIALPAPDAKAATEGFTTFLKSQGLTPAQVDPAAGADWTKVVYNTDPKLRDTNPGMYYWSQRFLYVYGIQQMKQLTDALRKNVPTAQIGANFSPHHGGSVHSYLGEVFKWISCFRQDGMTLPWAEDYAWQVPVSTQQMNGINLDLFRAGLRGKPDRKILYYVMPHWPGNTPNMWRRLYYNALAHGMKIIDLFEFRPVWAAYTENHVTKDEMYGEVLKGFRELGLYEDIIQGGQRRQAETGLWFSETGDIWGDNEGSFGEAKRTLYIGILHQQLPLDFIVDEDTQTGTLNQYKVLYLTDNHVSQASSKKIADWVSNGGHLFATAGAGMFDEYNQPNTVLRTLLGVAAQTALVSPADSQVSFGKQDLPFIQPIDKVTGAEVLGEAQPMPVFGTVSHVTAANGAQITGTFTDNSPAVIQNTVGKGQAIYCAFLPGLSYFKPAIPLKPLDRGSSDDAMAHFIPTAFDPAANRLISLPAATVIRPVECSDSLVEATVIEAKTGKLIMLQNWSGKPIQNLRLIVSIPLPLKNITLASGGQLKMEKLKNHQIAFTCNLNIADAIILR